MSRESTARNVYGILFQRREERHLSPVNARSPAVSSFVLGDSRVKSSSADIVRCSAVRNVTNSVRYTGARPVDFVMLLILEVVF